MRARLASFGAEHVDGKFYHGAGCDECRGTGYRGRTGIFELLAVTPELRELILQKRSSAEIKTAAQKSMITMHQDALQKAAAGVTTLEEIVRVASADKIE
jgi:type II secretory ATPase GspE/PulE/Tfp pilus assembly ATPase PilB-like protein